MATVHDFKIGPVGYGLMGLSFPNRKISDEQAFAAMKQALADGSNFWNGGEFYGTPESNSLTLLNRYFTKYPEDVDKVFLSIKGGLNDSRVPDGSAANVGRSVENCVRMLGSVKKIDLFQCGRIDPDVPLEETIGELAAQVKKGNIRSVGLSEVRAETIRRAVKVTPIAAVEVEVSLFADHILTNGVAETCAELNIPIIAYSPVGRGLFTGQFKSLAEMDAGDPRRMHPRFSEENFPKNLELVEKIEKMAASKGCSVPQLAISWVHQLSTRPGFPTFIPLPGSTTVERVKENANLVELSKDEMAEIDKHLAAFTPAGERYPTQFLRHLNG